MKKYLFYLCTGVIFLYYCYLLLNRPYFFDWDEWSIIINFLELNYFEWIFQPHLGHYFPFGKLVYSIELWLFRDSYYFYVLSNLLLHLVNSFLLFSLLNKYSDDFYTTFFGVVIYFISWNHIENLLWGMQIAVLLSVTITILSFHYIIKKDYNKKDYLFISILSFLAAFSFSFGLFLPVFFILYFFINYRYNEKRNIIHTFFILQIIIALFYFILYSIEFSFVHPNCAESQFSISTISSTLCSKALFYILNGICFIFFYFLTSIPLENELTSNYGVILFLQNFNIFMFVGSKKFFALFSSLIFLYFYRYKKDSSFVLNILNGTVFVLPFIIPLSLSKNAYLESVYQSRYYTYIGAFIIIFIITSITSTRLSDKLHRFITSILLLIICWNSFVTLVYLRDSDFKKSSLSVKESFLSCHFLNKDQSDLFHVDANPELTNSEVSLIYNFMKK